MAGDSVDIDALTMKARATARELNELLIGLESAGCKVAVVPYPRPEDAGRMFDFTRVELCVAFPKVYR